MRNLLLLICLIISGQSFAQKGLTGLWTGVLTNDSTTVRVDQGFEIALTQYKEKVYGYTRSSFIVNDTLFYIVKRVKGKVLGDVAEVTDDDIISSNFRGRIDKGVKVTYTFRMNQADSVWHIDGNWKTNKTKNYYSISGKAELKEEKNLDNSKLFPHLSELKLDKDVEFYAASKIPVKKEEKPTELAKADKAIKEKKKKVEKAKDTPTKDIAKNDKPVNQAKENKSEAPKKNEQSEKVEEDISTKIKNSGFTPPVVLPYKPESPVSAPVVKTTEEKMLERKLALPHIVNFKSDSLVLALYDNGEVDGDTVSVSLNGVMIMEKQGLKTVAIKKTIQVPADAEEMTMILFAENLGKYPPNTGLLVVRDGDDVYQVHFSADLTQNAAIIFRRKK